MLDNNLFKAFLNDLSKDIKPSKTIFEAVIKTIDNIENNNNKKKKSNRD